MEEKTVAWPDRLGADFSLFSMASSHLAIRKDNVLERPTCVTSTGTVFGTWTAHQRLVLTGAEPVQTAQAKQVQWDSSPVGF